MENFNLCDFDFTLSAFTNYPDGFKEKQKELSRLLDKINLVYKKEQTNFAELCFLVFSVKKMFDDYFDKTAHFLATARQSYKTFDSIMRSFGIDETQTSRILKVYEKFVELKDEKPHIKENLFGFSKSKLFELLSIDYDQLSVDIKNKVLRPDMSVKSIRDYVKNYQAIQKQKKKLNEPQEEKEEEEFNEEDIPAAYNPQQHYEFEYFEEKTKSQLLNIVWELQREYEKLKTNYNKLKNEKK